MNYSPTKTFDARPVRWTAALGSPRVWILQAGFLAALCFAGLTQKIPLPFTPVPLTLQVFVVFLAALFLKGRASLPVVGGYLALGAAGLPVFSSGASGVNHLFGATGGYLMGFLFAAWVVGTVMEYEEEEAEEARPNRNARLGRDSGALAMGLVVIYGFGALWFWGITGVEWPNVLAMTVFPFVAFDIVKVATAYTLYRVLERKVRRFLS